MPNLKLTISYDGGDFAGWQTQTGCRTVQESLEKVLSEIAGERIILEGSGRTDAGVHAIAQAANFRTARVLDCSSWRRALNDYLPRDIAVTAVEEVPDDFHARRSALRKRYRYCIHDGPTIDVFSRCYVWRIPRPLDDEAMRAAAACLVGTHDFRSFESSGSRRRSTVRTIHELTLVRPRPARPHELVIEIEADGFLYNMARAIVGTLAAVGRGKRPPEWVAQALAAQNRAQSGMTAPAHGLYLLRVIY